MSTTYQPGAPIGLSPEAAAWLAQELRAIKEGMERAKPYERLQVRYAAPARTFPGMVVYADGTTWNPGSGEGLYRCNLANAWVFLG